MSKYKQNKADAVTFNEEPTMTDQSQAAQTDINVIVTQFLRTGAAPVPRTEPHFGDFTQLPEDLRGFIDLGRSIGPLRESLPPQLQGIPLDQLITMSNEQITAILTPPESPKEDKREDLRDQGPSDRLLSAPVHRARRQERSGERGKADQQRGDDE